MTIASAADRAISRSHRNKNGCLVFGGYLDPMGYGRVMVTLPGRRYSALAHRIVFTAVHGEIPEGMVVRHSCDLPACLEITHLSLGTQADNIHDMWDRGRQRQYQSPLTEEEMQEMRDNPLVVSTHFARKFKRSIQTIRKYRER